MKTSHSFRLALVPGLIAAACLCWAASKPRQLSSFDPAGQSPAGAHDPRRKDRPDDPARPGRPQGSRRYRELCFSARILSGGGSDPKEGNSLQAWTDLYDSFQQHALNTRLQDPAALRRRCRARPQQRARRRHLPAQHRAGLHAQRRAGREDRAHHRRGSARHRHQLGLRALRHRAAGYPLGPHLRRLSPKIPSSCRSSARRPSAACRATTWPTRSPCWPAPSTTSATAAPPIGSATGQRHGSGPGRHPRRRSHPAPHPSAGLHHHRRRRASAPSCPPTAVGTA